MRKILLFPLLLSLFFLLFAWGVLAWGGGSPAFFPSFQSGGTPTPTPTPGSGPSLPWAWSTPSPVPSPSCPDSPPPWWGTATPSSYWYFLCGYCVSGWPRPDPFRTPTPFLPTVVLPTVSLSPTATPMATPTVTPTVTPALTPTPTPAPPMGPDQLLQLTVEKLGYQVSWEAHYELYTSQGLLIFPLTQTTRITFSPGSQLVFRAQIADTKTSNGDGFVKFMVGFVEPHRFGGENAIIDYLFSQEGSLYSDRCHIDSIAGPRSDSWILAADQTIYYPLEASGPGCSVPRMVDVGATWAGRSPADRGGSSPLDLHSRWGYSFYARGVISASVVISLSYGYIPPVLPTPTPSPTPSPTSTPPAGDVALCLDPNLGSGSDISDFLPVPRYHGSYCISVGPLGPYNLPVLGQIYVPYVQICFIPVTFGEFDFLGFRFSADIFLGAIVGLALIYILLGKS